MFGINITKNLVFNWINKRYFCSSKYLVIIIKLLITIIMFGMR